MILDRVVDVIVDVAFMWWMVVLRFDACVLGSRLGDHHLSCAPLLLSMAWWFILLHSLSESLISTVMAIDPGVDVGGSLLLSSYDVRSISYATHITGRGPQLRPLGRFNL